MHHVSTIYARFICRELGLSAETADELFIDSALSYQTIFQQALMPYPDFFSFLKRMRAHYSDEDLGLRVGSKLTAPSLGELGSAMLCSPSMMDAIKLSADFAHVHAAYYQLELEATAEGVKVLLIELADLGDTQTFQTEVMMLMIQNLLEAVIGEEFKNGHFYFPFAAPSHVDQYQRYFHCPYEFNAEHSAIEIPLQVLQTSSPFHDPEAWIAYRLKLEKQLNKLNNKARQQNSQRPYTSKVLSFLTSGPLPIPGIEDAAAHMAMTSRSLSRHLKSEGSSFRDMRNQLLQEYAEYYLRESELTVDAIACQLGYKDFSSFRRAFKNWHGCSPTEFRGRKSD